MSRTKRTPATPAMTLEERFANCHESFRAKVTDLAALAGKTWETVYGWWREYSEACSNCDQSAIWSEFREWYKDKLGVDPNVAIPSE